MASDRFIRWQGYTVSQLTFALNLFLGLSVGSLAFAVTLLRDERFMLSGSSRLAFSIGLLALFLSILAGCAAVVSRLLDFRFTARKVRADDTGDPNDESGVYKYRAKAFGKLTWRLFWTELTSFVIGLVGIAIGLFSAYGQQLW